MAEPINWAAYADAGAEEPKKDEEQTLAGSTPPAPKRLREENAYPELKKAHEGPKRPPDKPDFIREQFLKAISSEDFNAAPESVQRVYVNKLFDRHPDERVKKLTPKQRGRWLQRLTADLQEEHEYASSFAGQAEKVAGFKFDAGMRGFYDLLESNPATRTAMRAGTGAFNAVGAMIASAGTKAKMAAEDWQPPEPTGDERFDAKRMEIYERLKSRKSAEFLEPLIDDIEQTLEIAGRNRELGERMMEMAAEAPKYKDAASVEKFLEADGLLGQVSEGVPLVANTIVDSLSIMLPSIVAAGGNPAGLLAGMQMVHSGLQQQAAKEAGADLSYSQQELSGLVQSALGMAAGPEAWAVGRSGAKFIEQVMSSGFKSFGKKVIAGVGLEAATEFAQEWVNQQVPEWSKDNQGFWNNLDDTQKKEVLYGAILAPLAAGPFEIISAAKTTGQEVQLKKAAEASGLLSEETPEERGARGKIGPMLRDQYTEHTAAEFVHRHVPDFIQERGDEAVAEWIETVSEIRQPLADTEGMTPEQIEKEEKANAKVRHQIYYSKLSAEEQKLSHAAERAAYKEYQGPAPDVVADDTITDLQQQLRDRVRLRLKQIHKVDPAVADNVEVVVPRTDVKEHEFAREMAAFAKERGVELVFYKGPVGLPVGGIKLGDVEGVLGVQWMPRRMSGLVGETLVHEMVHNLDYYVPSAAKAIREILDANMTDKDRAAVLKHLKSIGVKEGTKVWDQEMLAYSAERYAPAVFRTIADLDNAKKLQEAPRGMRKVVEWFKGWVQTMATKHPELFRKAFGIQLNEDFKPEDQKQLAEIALVIAEGLETTRGQKPPEAKPAEPKPKPKMLKQKPPESVVGPKVSDVRPGDDVQITKGIGGKVVSVSMVGKNEYQIKLESGEVHLLNGDTKLRDLKTGPGKYTPPEAPEAPVAAPKKKAPEKPKAKPKPKEAPEAEEPAPKYEQGELFRTFWHFSVADPTTEGLKREFAGTGATGQERRRFRTKDGKLDPDSAMVHLYVPGKRPEYQVLGRAKRLLQLNTDLRLIDTRGPEHAKLMKQIMDEGIIEQDKILAEYLKRIREQGYDGIIDSDRGMAQVYRDILPEEIAESKELTYSMRRKLQKGLPANQTEADELMVEEIEDEVLKTYELDVTPYAEAEETTDFQDQMNGQYVGVITKNGERVGDMIMSVKFAGTNDETVWFEWIGVDEKMQEISAKGTIYGGLGTRGVIAMRQQLQKFFPNAKWVGGTRVGGVHYIEEGLKMVRIPIHTKTQRAKLGLELEPKDETELIVEYGLDAFYGNPSAPNEELTEDEYGGAEEFYDDADEDVFLQDEAAADFRQHSRAEADNAEFDLDRTMFYDVPFDDLGLPESITEWETEHYTKYGEHYGVPNLGGMGKLEKVGEIEVPGGTEGEWTYQELLWLKAQAIDPNLWTEEQHAAIMRKLGRSLTPAEPDPMHAVNSILFSLMSPQLNLSLNELIYQYLRFQDMDDVAEWSKRIPWDASKGEVAFVAEEDQKDFEQWKKELSRKGTDEALAKQYYSDKIKFEFGLHAKAHGGLLGELAGHFDFTVASELAQLFQTDPEWFLIGKGESWYAFATRLMSQLRGAGMKVAVFGAVWQDPLHASIAAVDTHMAWVYRNAIMGRGDLRQKFERDVLAKWNKKNPPSPQASLFGDPVQNIDDLSIVDPGFLVKEMIALTGKAVPRKYRPKGRSKYIVTPEFEKKASLAYKRAMNANMREARRLNIGGFSTQHFMWDRARSLFEPHAAMFPGLHRLPHPTTADLTRVKDALREADRHRKRKKEEGAYRMRRARSAPPSDIALAREAPSYFAPGTTRGPVDNVLHSTMGGTLNPNSGPMFIIPEETWLGMLKRKIKDKFQPVKQLQRSIRRAGYHISEEADVYLHELLYHGRAANRIKEFEKKYLQPLLDVIKEDEIDIAEFEEYLHARHAGERNHRLREIWFELRKANLENEIEGVEEEIEALEGMDDADTSKLKRRRSRLRKKLRDLLDAEIPTSGMDTITAAAIVAEKRERFARAEAAFRRMMDTKLQILLSGGLITQEQYDRVSIYEHYVPLKGKEYDGDLEILLDDIGAGTGLGFDVRGDELGFAYGRVGGSAHTHPILSQAVLDIEEAIIRVEKNVVGQSFLALVNEFPDKEHWEVNKRLRRRVWSSKKGEPVFVEDAYAKRQDNVLAVKQDGETYYIYIKDSRLASALKNIGTPHHGKVVQVLGAANRFFAKINTTLNPEFMVSNFARDLQTAMIHLNSKEAEGIAKDSMKNLIPMLGAIANVEFKDGHGVDEEFYREFQKAGGQIGFFGYNDVMSLAKGLDTLIKRQGPGVGKVTFRQIMKVAKLIEAGNTVVENGIRVAAYKGARQNGASPKKAAAIARRLTVNFNKKGEWGSTINAVWLFSNASIQGTARMIQALGSKRVRALVGTIVLGNIGLSFINRALAGEDEEDKTPYYEKVPAWVKETNTVIMLPEGKGKYIKIPMAYGYNVWAVLGQEIGDLLYKGWNGQLKATDPIRSAVNFTDAAVGAFNPMGSTRLSSAWGVFRFIVPTIAAPIADTLVNETYYGSDIMPTRSSWDHKPASQRYFRGVSDTSRLLADYANRATGGNDYQPGFVDMNPEVLDYLVRSYSGAGPMTAKRVLWDGSNWLFDAVRGEVRRPEANDVAFIRRVYGEENDHTVASVYYENLEEVKQAKDAYEKGKLGSNPGWRKRYGWMMPLFKKSEKMERDLRKAKTPEEKNKIRKRFNRYYRQAWLRQFD